MSDFKPEKPTEEELEEQRRDLLHKAKVSIRNSGTDAAGNPLSEQWLSEYLDDLTFVQLEQAIALALRMQAKDISRGLAAAAGQSISDAELNRQFDHMSSTDIRQWLTHTRPAVAQMPSDVDRALDDTPGKAIQNLEEPAEEAPPVDSASEEKMLHELRSTLKDLMRSSVALAGQNVSDQELDEHFDPMTLKETRAWFAESAPPLMKATGQGRRAMAEALKGVQRRAVTKAIPELQTERVSPSPSSQAASGCLILTFFITALGGLVLKL